MPIIVNDDAALTNVMMPLQWVNNILLCTYINMYKDFFLSEFLSYYSPHSPESKYTLPNPEIELTINVIKFRPKGHWDMLMSFDVTSISILLHYQN